MSNNEMMNLADRLKVLRDEKSDMQAQLKDIQTDIDTVEAQLIELMTNEECTGFDRNGTRFSLVIKTYPGAVPEKKDELYDRMKEHGFEHLFTINTRTLQGTVKELIANNDDMLPDWLEGLINQYEDASIMVRKSR